MASGSWTAAPSSNRNEVWIRQRFRRPISPQDSTGFEPIPVQIPAGALLLLARTRSAPRTLHNEIGWPPPPAPC